MCSYLIIHSNSTIKNFFFIFILFCYVFLSFFKCILQHTRALTLPDSSSVNVDLHRICRVERLVIVEDEDVTAQGMDTSGEHCCILGEVDDGRREGKKR